ncbi:MULTISPECIES: class I SAM-dependent methyltransferase [Desulfitobacterium]|uniref:Methylase involved in ubiquinone/menaquinone biosynthesis n=1 Tax=Desulfitobacterium dehalogenans (strain ATCC 51507 / DSM 9161 / JW/IU-DC1) TaxID=756499 RepID=I4A8K7_DESDJ|nr:MULTISPECIES: class I SAM-dependent methyltransferase [Desulfitobacterium]AFM00292.1 methylase involved in ubiquinone/menaquinone biosynthesis [Desulfitobacterium dehalogenans ATCC 51507]
MEAIQHGSIEKNKSVGDMNYFELLAWLGIGSSHPGGFPATIKNLEVMDVNSEDFILDAGCGSGLTVCQLAKSKGCKIIGVDINSQMIEKARQRAEHEEVAHLAEFRVADVNSLPFPDNHFDWVMCESITVFLDKEKVYKEFFRVLKPEGRIADLEMALLYELPPQLRSQMEFCYGKGTAPLSFEEWSKTLAEAGFEDVEIKNPQALRNTNSNLILNELKKDWMLVKDLVQKVSSHPGLYRRLQQNANFMKNYKGYFGFGLICGRKPTPPEPPKKPTLKERFLNNLKIFKDKIPHRKSFSV